MKKIMLATAAAAALLTGAASWQPAQAQVRHYHNGGYYGGGYYGGGWGWNNPVAFGAGAIVGTAAAIATAPLWAATNGYGYGYDYAPAYYPAGYGYGYGYAEPVYAPAPVVYRTRVAPRRIVYTQRVAPRRVIYTNRVVAPRRVIRANQRVIVRDRHAVRTIRY